MDWQENDTVYVAIQMLSSKMQMQPSAGPHHHNRSSEATSDLSARLHIG